MNIRKILMLSVLSLALALGTSAVARAASPGDTATCKFIYEEGLGKGFTASGNTVSTNVIVSGDSSCRKDFVLASFIIPHDTLTPYPVEDQKLYDHAVLKDVGPGKYKMTVKVPQCFHQVDLALGTNPTGPNGRLPYEPNRLLNAYLGGNQKCVDQPTVTTTPVVTPATPAVKDGAKKLPSTGPESVLVSALSVASVSGLLHRAYNRRNSVRK